jgi:hypothetical protein
MCVWMISGNTEINWVRNTYKLAVEQSGKADELVNMTGNYGNNGVLMAYYGTGKALQAKHGWNPASRFALAREAASLLNKSVLVSPQNLEVRFLRFSFESRAPSILGLTLHTSEDKAWIMAHLDKKHPIWDTMKAFLKDCSLLTTTDKQKLN